jgi:hypothetical protein
MSGGIAASNSVFLLRLRYKSILAYQWGLQWAISHLTRGAYSRWRSRLVDRLMIEVEAHRTGCPRCGSDAVDVRASKPGSPHAAGEYCGACGRWRRWLSKREVASLRGNGGAS